jgi:hypothetical protein
VDSALRRSEKLLQKLEVEAVGQLLYVVERAMGIEPTSEAWEASILPLYDARSPRKHRVICRITLGSRAAQEGGTFFCDPSRMRSSHKIERRSYTTSRISRAQSNRRSRNILRSGNSVNDRVVEVKPVEIGHGHRAFSYARGDWLVAA